VGEADHGLGGADRSGAGAVSEAWSDHVQEVQHLGAVGFQRPGGFAQGEGEPAELTVADSLVWVGRGWAPAPPSPARAVSVRARRAVSRSSSSPVSSSARRQVPVLGRGAAGCAAAFRTSRRSAARCPPSLRCAARRADPRRSWAQGIGRRPASQVCPAGLERGGGAWHVRPPRASPWPQSTRGPVRARARG